MIEIKQIPLGPLQTNCYLLIKKNECLIIDPGAEGEQLIKFIEDKQLTLQAILLTHSHYDHIGAVDDLRNHFNTKVYIHKNENKWLNDPSMNGSQAFGFPSKVNEADYLFTEDKDFEIGSFKFKVLHTPGHSPGGVSFYFLAEKFVVTGDALFQSSIGRTDLREGNHAQLINSIRSKLLTLPDDTQVLPGHGPTSTIGSEKSNNPFIS